MAHAGNTAPAWASLGGDVRLLTATVSRDIYHLINTGHKIAGRTSLKTMKSREDKYDRAAIN